LQIPEILRAITREVHYNEKNLQGYNHAMLMLAYTCWAFSEPALDLLWLAPPPWALAERMKADTFIVTDTQYEEHIRRAVDQAPVRGIVRTLVSLSTRM
jgi:hypothetical protein